MTSSQKHFNTLRNTGDSNNANNIYMELCNDLHHALAVQQAEPLATLTRFMKHGFDCLPSSLHDSWTFLVLGQAASYPSASAFQWICSQPQYLKSIEATGNENLVLNKMAVKYLEPKTSEQSREELLFMWEEAVVKLNVDAFVNASNPGDFTSNATKGMFMSMALKKFNKSLPDFLKEQGCPLVCQFKNKHSHLDTRVSAVAELNHVWQLEQLVQMGYDLVSDQNALEDLKKYMKNAAYEAFFNTKIEKEKLACDTSFTIVDHEVSFYMSLRLIEGLMRERGLNFKRWMTELAFDPAEPLYKNLGMDLLQEFVLETYKDLTPYSFIFKDTPRQMTLKEAAEESAKGAANYYTKDLAKQWHLMETVKQTDPRLDHHQVEFRF